MGLQRLMLAVAGCLPTTVPAFLPMAFQLSPTLLAMNDKTFAASATTRKASRRKVSGKSAASGTPALRWVNMGTNNAAFPEPVSTYLTTLAAHKAVNDFDILLGTIQALL